MTYPVYRKKISVACVQIVKIISPSRAVRVNDFGELSRDIELIEATTLPTIEGRYPDTATEQEFNEAYEKTLAHITAAIH